MLMAVTLNTVHTCVIKVTNICHECLHILLYLCKPRKADSICRQLDDCNVHCVSKSSPFYFVMTWSNVDNCIQRRKFATK